MKKILLLMALVLVTVSARAFTIGLEIDNASRCEAYVGDDKVADLVTGRNNIDVPGTWAYITIKPTPGNKIETVYYEDDPSWDERVDPEGNCTFRASQPTKAPTGLSRLRPWATPAPPPPPSSSTMPPR